MEFTPTLKGPRGASGDAHPRGAQTPLRAELPRGMDAYRRAANYLGE